MVRRAPALCRRAALPDREAPSGVHTPDGSNAGGVRSVIGLTVIPMIAIVPSGSGRRLMHCPGDSHLPGRSGEQSAASLRGDMPVNDRRAFLTGCAATAAGAAMSPLAIAGDGDARPEIQALRSGRVGQFQSGVHLLPATSETVQWGWFDQDEAPRARIKPGDTVVMETMMGSLNQILPGSTIEEITRLRVDHPGRGPHSITGPVFVEGALPGDSLRIRINRIVPRPYGANWNLPGDLRLGQFPDVFTEAQVKHFYFDMRRGVTEFAPGIEIPVRPFPGIMGVARAESGRFSTVPPGPFGGNMDVRELVAGSILELPVFVDGALLWSGDSHAAQGNGEINLTAIETAFSELNFTVELVKGSRLAWPRIETPTHWITLGYDRDLSRALELLREETMKFLVETRGLSTRAAADHMSRFGDCRVAEVVNGVKGLYCRLPKRARGPVPARPVAETRHHFVSHATHADLMQAMNQAAMRIIDTVATRKSMTRLDAYALASLAMDARIGRVEPGAASVHCLLPKSLWTGARG
jgi:acetamidase/formamidase